MSLNMQAKLKEALVDKIKKEEIVNRNKPPPYDPNFCFFTQEPKGYPYQYSERSVHKYQGQKAAAAEEK